jgi:VIT1/CCC1 family predicted Fe2+/Mn2+ transporter
MTDLTEKASAAESRRLRWVTGDRVLRIGLVVTALGLVAAVIAMLPLIVPAIEPSGIWWFLAMITGVGLAIVIVGLIISARERSARIAKQ